MHSKCARRFFLVCSSILILSPPAFSETIPPLPAPTVAPVAPEKYGPKATLAINGKTPLNLRSKDGHFPLTGIRPREMVEIKLQFPLSWASTPLVVQAPDGGNFVGPPKARVIGPDGTATFRFQVADLPGLYRLSIIGGGRSSTLKLWVTDPQKPHANPPVVSAGN